MSDQELVVIPDIHGRWDKLQNLLGTLCFYGKTLDNLVILGDMIDRGPDSAQVLNWLMHHREKYPNTVILRGNHEEMMIDYLSTGNERWFRPNNGGVATIESYRRFLKTDFRSSSHLIRALREIGHFQFLSSLKPYYETKHYFFSHAPIPKERYWPADLRPTPPLTYPEILYSWSYPSKIAEDEYARTHTDKYAICGHVHRLREQIFAARRYDHITYLDAGCGCHPNAALAALILPLEPDTTQPGEVIYSL